jgi:hypothetical protein
VCRNLRPCRLKARCKGAKYLIICASYELEVRVNIASDPSESPHPSSAMILSLFQLLSLLPILTPTLCVRLAISIPSTQLLSNPSTLPSSTHATLHAHGTHVSALLTRSNKFFFDDVAPGSYLLNVHCRDYHFEPLRIDVVSNDTAPGGEYVMSWQTFRGNEWDNKGEIRGQGYGADPEGVKIEARPTGVKDYYQPRQGCKFSHYPCIKLLSVC